MSKPHTHKERQTERQSYFRKLIQQLMSVNARKLYLVIKKKKKKNSLPRDAMNLLPHSNGSFRSRAGLDAYWLVIGLSTLHELHSFLLQLTRLAIAPNVTVYELKISVGERRIRPITSINSICHII